MNPFTYRDNRLQCEDVDLTALAAKYGTPSYVYSANAIRTRFRAYEDALAGLPHQVCYAVKACSNLAILSLLSREGAGFDIVSGGELYRVIAAGGDPAKVVFSGVGKTDDEISYALEQRIHSFNCESEHEIQTISRLATAMGVKVSIALRVNPNVDAETLHHYIATGLNEHKFGVGIEQAEAIYRRAADLPGLVVDGVSCHIGSQITKAQPFLDAADEVLALVTRLRASGFVIRTLDLGGGLGVPYETKVDAVSTASFITQLRAKIEGLDLKLMLEPGRSIVAEAAVLLTRVILVKDNGYKTFVIVDAGMNDLIRPALYEAYHRIEPVMLNSAERITADVVGPVCETGDFLALAREIPAMAAGDLAVVHTAGAYGASMSSTYNSRPLACELLVDGANVRVIRMRQTYEALVREEIVSGCVSEINLLG